VPEEACVFLDEVFLVFRDIVDRMNRVGRAADAGAAVDAALGVRII